MADQIFSGEDQKNLMAQFDRVEGHDMVAGTHEKFLRIANDLSERYGVPHPVVHQETGHSGVPGPFGPPAVAVHSARRSTS
jgi:hypothetical protein